MTPTASGDHQKPTKLKKPMANGITKLKARSYRALGFPHNWTQSQVPDNPLAQALCTPVRLLSHSTKNLVFFFYSYSWPHCWTIEMMGFCWIHASYLGLQMSQVARRIVRSNSTRTIDKVLHHSHINKIQRSLYKQQAQTCVRRCTH